MPHVAAVLDTGCVGVSWLFLWVGVGLETQTALSPPHRILSKYAPTHYDDKLLRRRHHRSTPSRATPPHPTETTTPLSATLATRSARMTKNHFPEHSTRSQTPPRPAPPIDTLSHIPPPFTSPPARPATPSAVPPTRSPETHRMDQVILLRQGM